MKEEKKTSSVMTEKGTWVRFGLIPFYIRPLTLAQIWEIGELIQECKAVELQGSFNPIEKMLESHKDLHFLQKVVEKAIFRGSVARFLLGWYIRKRTTMKRYKQVITFCAQSFDAPFFFQSMTFLRGAKRVTMNTREAQVHGASSEE